MTLSSNDQNLIPQLNNVNPILQSSHPAHPQSRTLLHKQLHEIQCAWGFYKAIASSKSFLQESILLLRAIDDDITLGHQCPRAGTRYRADTRRLEQLLCVALHCCDPITLIREIVRLRFAAHCVLVSLFARVDPVVSPSLADFCLRARGADYYTIGSASRRLQYWEIYVTLLSD